MKKIAFLIALSCLSLSSVNAQMGNMGKSGANSAMSKMGKIYGKVVDAETGKPVDFALVVLLQDKQGKEILVKSANTTANGEFSLDELPLFGQYKLAINNVGYKQYKVPFQFDMQALMKAGAAMGKNGSADYSSMSSMPDGAGSLLAIVNRDLGNIKLEPTKEQLKTVTVKSTVAQFSLQGEKKVFNVDKNLTSQGSTAQDVMKNVPGVLVDADGKVSIRNSSPQLLIDGKQSPLQLDQIPADAIESVEVITNPSAKYDAEGGAGGVLNIVLKKNRKTGYNGGIRAGVDSRGGANFGLDFNYRNGKVNFSAVGHSNMMRNRTTAQTARFDESTTPGRNTFQDDVNNSNGAFAFGRIGLDYFITNRTTFSLGYTKVHGQFKPKSNLDITIDTVLAGSSYATRNTQGTNEFDMNGMQFGIKHLFPKAGREWTFDASANMGKNSNANEFSTNYYTNANRDNIASTLRQRADGGGENNFYTVQSDFVNPIGKTDKIEMGVKATIRAVKSTNDNYVKYPGATSEVLMPNIYSSYKNTDQVYAAYVSYSGNLNANMSYQLGLRAEGSEYKGTLESNNQTFTNSYPVSLFPSVFFTRKMKKDQQLQFTYRRGINRPNFFQILPYADYSDPLNIRQGNPGLRPEFTNTVELTYMKNFTRSNYVMASAYYRRSDNLITQYQSLGYNRFDSTQQVLVTSYINASNSDRYGIELTSGWDVVKWWNVLANVNVYNATLYNGVPGGGNANNYLSGFFKLNNNIKLPYKLSLQVSGVYQSRTNMLPDGKNEGHRGGPMMQSNSSSQGYLDANWSMDLALKWSFLKDMASLSLSVNDVFGTRKFIQYSEGDYFNQTYSRLTNPTMFRLNFSWRFGKMDTDLFRRKNVKGQMEGMQDAAQNAGM